MRQVHPARSRRLVPAAAAAVMLPASYFGVSAALGHLGGHPAGADALGCPAAGCVASPVAAASSPAGRTAAARRARPHAGDQRKPSTVGVVRRASTNRTAPPSPAASHPSPESSPSPDPTGTPSPAGPPVTVTYQELNGWPGGFMGQFTLVNHGQQPVGGWRLAAALPGDEVTGADGVNWYQNGDVIILQPFPWYGPIEPGATLTISVTAEGNTSSPASCSFDGSACR
jgi:Cellulose binding domain